MQYKIELSTEDLALIKYVLNHTKEELPKAVAIYVQDGEIETAKAFADDLTRAENLITLISKLID